MDDDETNTHLEKLPGATLCACLIFVLSFIHLQVWIFFTLIIPQSAHSIIIHESSPLASLRRQTMNLLVNNLTG